MRRRRGPPMDPASSCTRRLQKTLTVDMAKVGGTTARGWWFDPATGAATLIGDFATSGSRSFTPATAQDWVLVLDNASLNLAAPGQ